MSSFDWVGPKIERGQLMDVDGGELSEYRKMQLGNVSSVGGSYGPCPFQAWVQICKDCFVSSPPFILHIFLKAFPLSLEVVIYITHLTCKVIIPFFMPCRAPPRTSSAISADDLFEENLSQSHPSGCR